MIVFLLKLTVTWGLFALLFATLLRRETFFHANRFYLLGTATAGIFLALPVDWFAGLTDKASLAVLTLPVATVVWQQAEEATNLWNRQGLLWMAYLMGAGLTFLRMLWGLSRLYLMAKEGKRQRLPDGCVLVTTAAARVPFSFFHWVFVPVNEPEYSGNYATKAMLDHERAHVRGWHSADVLFMELLCIVFWFHPLAHWYRRTLRTVHEYLADAEASGQSDKKQYGLLLIRQAQSGVSLVCVNHFFQSPLKQRLIMLTKNASPVLRSWKYGLMLPLLTMLFPLTRQMPVREQGDARAQKMKDVYELSEIGQMPEFPDGQAALARFLGTNIKYPEAAKRDSAEGVITVMFTIDENGEVTDVGVPEGNEPSGADSGRRQDFQDEAIRVVKRMPRWSPALSTQHKAVKVRLTLPIRFKLE